MGKNIGFISTRFSGTDGVTLEASKWADVLKEFGHRFLWFAGELDRNPKYSFCVPEAHFKHEKNLWLEKRIFSHKVRAPAVTDVIHELRSFLKKRLREFINEFDVDLLIVENALTIPMNVPLGLAITEVIAETQIPAIAHHHDFYWERTRYSLNAVGDYLRMAFPPNLHNIEHVVINSFAQEALALRTGISSVIIPNIIDFENPPKVNGEKTEKVRQSLELEPDDLMILQPTRIIQRKGIEHAIELVSELRDPKYKLVICHNPGDEGVEYAEWLTQEAKDHGVDLRIVNLRIADPWNPSEEGQELPPDTFTLLDIYPHADFITYPSLYEGFGNAFLEAIYFKKPILINRYAIFVRDIEPQGFDLAVMDGFLKSDTVRFVKEILNNPERRERMVNKNYEIATHHYSYSVLRKRLGNLMDSFFGVKV